MVMESKTLAFVDSTLWFIRVGVAAMLMVGAVSDAANGNSLKPTLRLEDASEIKVQLVRRPAERKTRRLHGSAAVVCSVETGWGA